MGQHIRDNIGHCGTFWDSLGHHGVRKMSPRGRRIHPRERFARDDDKSGITTGTTGATGILVFYYYFLFSLLFPGGSCSVFGDVMMEIITIMNMLFRQACKYFHLLGRECES